MFAKLKSDSYLRSSIVLAIDVATSAVSSAVVLLLCSVLVAGLASGPLQITWIAASALFSAISFYLTRIYRYIIRYSTLHEFVRMCFGVALKDIMLAVLAAAVIAGSTLVSPKVAVVVIVMDFFITVAAMLLVRVLMLVAYRVFMNMARHDVELENILVYGTDDKSASVVTRLEKSSHYKVKGFIVHDNKGSQRILRGLPVCTFASIADIRNLKRKFSLGGVLFASPAGLRSEQDDLIDLCQKAGLKVFIAPQIDEVSDTRHFSSAIRKIKIEDLLGRSEIQISMDEIRNDMTGKTVMVTGAAGSIGSELCRQLASLGIGRLIMLDNAETPLHNVRLEFEDNWPALDFVPVIGDVRSSERLDFVFRNYRPQIVFHAAAYKHVPLMEENPCEAVLVNVIGSRNVADKCVEYGIEKMVMVSTDKAVNPTNIMGCTKRLAEIYVQSLGLAIGNGSVKGSTRFVTTRFGNVLGSNGSVIPRFKEQIEKGGPVTVTDPEIRRFFMTIPEACRLVMEAATMASGTQIFVFDMGTPIKISDLATRMISLAGFTPGQDIKIEYTGLRPGEKLYEEVLATKENTIPTNHQRIFVAKVRDYSYDAALEISRQLEILSRNVNIPEMVILMKQTVPEFKSRHSVFEKYDNPSYTGLEEK